MVKKSNNNLVIMVIGVLVLVGVITFVFMPLNEQSQANNLEIDTLNSEIAVLEGHEAKLSVYEEEIAASRQYVQSQLPLYPADITEEDAIMWHIYFNDLINGESNQVLFNPHNLLVSFNAFANPEQDANLVTMDAYSVDVAFNSLFEYGNFKNTLDTIYAQPDRMGINSVSISYDAASAQIVADFAFSRFYLSYPGAIYEPLTIPDVPLGVENPFRVSGLQADE